MSTQLSDDLHDDFSSEIDMYDDPYDVVMYDIDSVVANDVYGLLNLIADPDRSWYAKRRLSTLVAAGPLSALVADIIVDSLGRRWNPLLHPRDRYGRFIETGGFFRWFIKGAWYKGQVVRIDSDGTIHARSKGNDRIPDGTPLKFNHKYASKLVSTASDKADLTPEDLPDLHADIPNFPEASVTQRRIYNALQFGDMPGEDLDIYRETGDISGTDFGNEITGLVERGLIEIDKGDKPRVRRTDQDQLGVRDIGDDDIEDVPDDDTPDFDDGPVLTKTQRDLIDQMVELDRGEGDGVGRDEIPDASDEDLDALVEAGVLTRDGDGPYHLENPEGDAGTGDVPETDEVPERDVADDLDAAAQQYFPDDLEMQEAFIHHGAVLAIPDYDGEAPEGLRPAQDRRARTAAEAWWEEYNAPEPDGDVSEPEADVPEPEEENGLKYDRATLMRRGKFLLSHYLDEDYIDSEEGEAYALDIGDLIHGEELRRNGETEQADFYRNRGRNNLAKEGLDQKEIDSWDPVIEAYLNGEGLGEGDEGEEVDVPESDVDVPESDVPEADIPEADVPEEDFDAFLNEGLDEQQALEDAAEDAAGGSWDDFAQRLNDEGLAADYDERLAQEQRLADELGLDPRDESAPWGWINFSDAVGEERARQLFVENDGSVGRAIANNEAGAERRDTLPETDEPEIDVDVEGLNQWVQFAERVRSRRDDDNDLNDEMISEKMIADEMGLDLNTRGGIMTWTSFVRDYDVDMDEAEALYQKHNGDVSMAALDYIANLDGEGVPDVPDVDVDEPEPVEVDKQLRPEDLVPGDESVAFQKVLNRPEFWEDKPDFEQAGVVHDRAGNEMVIGAWYRANKGGEGDPDQLVAIPDQAKYPGLVFVQTPDGKMKVVVANDPNNPRAGLNRELNPDSDVLARARVQRAVAGDKILPLDQNNPKNLIDGQYPGEVGMRVGGKGDKGLFQDGDEGIIVRISGWNKQANRPFYYVKKANDPGGKEMQIAPGRMVKLEDAPHVPSDLNAPDVDVPGDIPEGDIRPGVWGLPNSDGEVAQLVQELGGEADYVDFLNGFANPGAAHDRVQRAIDAGRLEIIPGDGQEGRARLRLRDNTPALPEGAENEFEGNVLNGIDGADGAGVPRGALIDIDEPDAAEKLAGLRALVDRGVVEEFDDPETGRKLYRRAEANSGLAEGAENELEARILDGIDGFDRPVRRGELMDLDDPDLDEQMEALDELVFRGVLRRSTDDDGRVVYSRAGSGGSPTPMSEEEAVAALRSGGDPILIANRNLDSALRAAGLRRVPNGDAGISPNDWVMSEEDGPFPVKIPGQPPQSKKVYMVKASGGLVNDMLNEVMAGAISAEVLENKGRDDENGPLFHPRVGMARAPQGLGSRAGGAIIMDHAAYGYQEGHEFWNGNPDPDWRDDKVKGLSDTELFDGGANADMIMLGLYDYIINNTKDRHAKNQMYVRDPNTGRVRVVIIDNGFGFGAADHDSLGDDVNNEVSFDNYIQQLRPRTLFRRLRRRNEAQVRGAVQRFVDNYQDFDVESAMNRIRAAYPDITPEQEQYARDWLNVSKARAEAVAADIDGVVNAIMSI